MRIFFYVQHLLGVGHLKRVSLISKALERKGHQVLCASGGKSVSSFTDGLNNFIQLPPLYVKDERFDLLTLDDQKPDSSYLEKRRHLLSDLYDDFRPALLITEHFPFGRFQLENEILPLLEKAKKNDVPIYASVRDLLVSQKNDHKIQVICSILDEFYDVALVHGDKSLKELWVPYLGRKTKFCWTGYIKDEAVPIQLSLDSLFHRKPVLICGGGRSVSSDLIDFLLEIKNQTILKNNPWIFIGEKKQKKGEDVFFIDFLPNLSAYFNHCSFIISEAGYNSFVETLDSLVPVLYFPFVTEKEDEQLQRLDFFKEKLGLFYIPPFDLKKEIVIEKINKAFQQRNILDKIDLDGLRKAVNFIEFFNRAL